MITKGEGGIGQQFTDPTPTCTVQSMPSLDDVVIPHVHIYDKWMSDFSSSMKEHKSDTKENLTC